MIQIVPPLATDPSRSADADGVLRMFSGVPPVCAMPVPAYFAAATAGEAATRLPAMTVAAASAASFFTVPPPGTRMRAPPGKRLPTPGCHGVPERSRNGCAPRGETRTRTAPLDDRA